jgi:hypothetical protein
MLLDDSDQGLRETSGFFRPGFIPPPETVISKKSTKCGRDMMRMTQYATDAMFELLPEFKAKELLILLLFLHYSIIKLCSEECNTLFFGNISPFNQNIQIYTADKDPNNFPLPTKFGPFHAEADFGNHLYQDGVDDDLRKSAAAVNARENRSISTHSHVHLINMAIEDGRLAGILK